MYAGKKLHKFEGTQCLQHQGFRSPVTVSEQNSSILLYDTDCEDWGNSSSKMLLIIYHSIWNQIPKVFINTTVTVSKLTKEKLLFMNGCECNSPTSTTGILKLVPRRDKLVCSGLWWKIMIIQWNTWATFNVLMTDLLFFDPRNLTHSTSFTCISKNNSPTNTTTLWTSLLTCWALNGRKKRKWTHRCMHEHTTFL